MSKKLFEAMKVEATTYLLKEVKTYKGENGMAYSARYFSVIDGWIVCNQTLKARTRRVG